jgi:hypothetical protein
VSLLECPGCGKRHRAGPDFAKTVERCRAARSTSNTLPDCSACDAIEEGGQPTTPHTHSGTDRRGRPIPIEPPRRTAPLSLVVKLASLAVHVEEMLSNDGHAFDEQAIRGLLNDSEVRAWLDDPKHKALLPLKRRKADGR